MSRKPQGELLKWRVREGEGMVWRSEDKRRVYFGGQEFEATLEEAQWNPYMARRIELVKEELPTPEKPEPAPRRRGRPPRRTVAYDTPDIDKEL